eukprot:5773735-Karenia_brevis.AAC.1
MDQGGRPSRPSNEVSQQQPVLEYVKSVAAQKDIVCPDEEEDIALELLKGQNLPRSQRVRLADQTEK